VRLCRKYYWASHELHCASIVSVTCMSPLRAKSIGGVRSRGWHASDVEMSWQVRGSRRRHIVCCATTCAHPLDPTPAKQPCQSGDVQGNLTGMNDDPDLEHLGGNSTWRWGSLSLSRCNCSTLADLPSPPTCVRLLEKKYPCIVASCLESISSHEYATIQGRESSFSSSILCPPAK
jgi:hypothetical protein